MSKPIAIVAGEPNSISSEIIFKSWKLRKKFIHKPFLVIGSIDLLNLQKKQLKYKIKMKKINGDFKKSDLMGRELPIYDIKYFQRKSFEKISDKSNKYIFKCFNLAIKLTRSLIDISIPDPTLTGPGLSYFSVARIRIIFSLPCIAYHSILKFLKKMNK